jgi:hypothetical protein
VGLVTTVAQTIVRGMALLPKSHEARIWYETSLSAPLEVSVVPANATACTLATKNDHVELQMYNFVQLQRLKVKQVLSKKQTVKIWCLSVFVITTNSATPAENRINPHALFVSGRPRWWQHTT